MLFSFFSVARVWILCMFWSKLEKKKRKRIYWRSLWPNIKPQHLGGANHTYPPANQTTKPPFLHLTRHKPQTCLAWSD